MEDQIKCPKCQSTQITADKKGFSGKKAVAGAVLTGGIGLLAGTIGSNKTKLTCLKCGHTFSPGEDYESVQKKNKDMAELNKNPGCVVVVIFVVFIVIALLARSCSGCNSGGGSAATIDTSKTSLDTAYHTEAAPKISKEDSIENAKWNKTKAGRIYKKHPDWDKDDCEKVAKRLIWVGMTLDMLKYERGNPNTVNPSDYGSGIHYQWCWEEYTPSCFYGGEDQIITSFN